MHFKILPAILLVLLVACQVTGGPSRLVEQTTGVLHVYANGTSGNDAWDGSAAANTPGTLVGPKKTLQAVFNLVPYVVKHNVAVHLAGVFTANTGILSRTVAPGTYLVVDGGTDVTTVADNGGSPWTADISSAASIGLTTAGWTPDAYFGYWVVILDGPAAGQTRAIQSHTATTITPVRDFSVDPGTAQFRIVRPSTEIGGASTLTVRDFDSGILNVQNIYVSGSSVVGSMGDSVGAVPTYSHVILNSSSTKAFQVEQCGLASDFRRRNLTTWALESASTVGAAGVSSVHATGGVTAHVLGTLTAFSLITRNLWVGQGGLLNGFSYGSRAIKFVLAGGVDTTKDGSALIVNTAGFATTRFGGAGGGVYLIDAAVRLGAGVDISGCSSHGIVVNRSRLHLDGAVTGTGNAGAGVYAHSGSVVHIKHGAPPTLTGTVGDLSFDGSTPVAGGWADIDGGTPVASAAEVSVAKEVP